jgi:hypothetical protein
MVALGDWNNRHDGCRHHGRLVRRVIRPDGRIRIRRQLDLDRMGDLAGSRDGIPKRCLGWSLVSTPRLLLRDSILRAGGTHLRLPRSTLVQAIAPSCPVVCEASSSQIPAGSPTDHDSNHARSRSGPSRHIRGDPRNHVVGLTLPLVGCGGMAAPVQSPAQRVSRVVSEADSCPIGPPSDKRSACSSEFKLVGRGLQRQLCARANRVATGSPAFDHRQDRR